MKLAVLKPDHLGDLVLSSPAIRAMAGAHPELVLFVASGSVALARALFPGVEVAAYDMPHLARRAPAAQADLPDLLGFDAVAVLRRDGVITPDWARPRMRRFAMPAEDGYDLHQSVLDYGVAREFAPAYDIDALFYGPRLGEVAARAARAPGRVGFAIGSGFHANIWPLTRWIDLGRRLTARGVELTVVHGPAEAAAAALIGAQLPGAQLLGVGGDFPRLFEAAAALDLVIASDGGSAHLCATAAPVLSIFGPSPLRRYAPIGPWNRAISQQLACAPCLQYDARRVNGCLSVECMGAITADDVLAALDAPFVAGEARVLRPGLTLFGAPAAMDRAAALDALEFDHALWSGGGAADHG